MTVPTKSIAQFVSDMIATWQSQTGVVSTFTSGDGLLAIWQSFATQLDFLQAQIQLVLNLTRAQTSTGADLDSFINGQFGFARSPATFASGPVQFGKLSAGTSPVLVPVGSIVQTPGGAIQYQVVADTAQPAWNATGNGYLLAAGQTSLTATATALTAGSAANVAAGALSQIASSIPGIDTVTNTAPISNGRDAESDAAYRAGFILWLASLGKGTKSAITIAVEGIQQGITANLLENETPQGLAQQGCFSVIVDDGSGSPPATVITNAQAAVDATRAFGVQAFTAGPTLLSATIALTVRITVGANASTVNAAVQAAVVAAVNSLEQGQTLFASAINQAALGVANVVAVAAGTTINGMTSDLVPQGFQEIRIGVNNVTVGNY